MKRYIRATTSLPPLNRRLFGLHVGSSLCGIALTSLLDESSHRSLAQTPTIDPTRPFTERPPHMAPRATQMIVIHCSGALSHVDTFDYKPLLEQLDGQPMPGNERLVSFQGENGNLTRPLWRFRPRGQSGKMISDLVPHIAELADELCFVHSLETKSNTHGPAENVMSTGFVFDGFPSMGAWVNFALGTANEDLPAFVAIEDPRGMPQSGPNNWASGFLPAAFQGTPFSTTKPIQYLQRPAHVSAATDRATRDALRFLNQAYRDRNQGEVELDARIANYALAARMQLSVPKASNISQEPDHVLKLYGADSSDGNKKAFARNCILARRLIERGVRFVQLFNGAYASGGRLNWDGHSKLKSQYDGHARILDQPVAGLLRDLKQRGLLDSTLVLFTTEFGRMPMFQAGTYGRDHNPFGFTAWLAGAGVKTPFTFGATDQFGFKASENVVTVHDLHATILRILGLEHKRLTFYHNGIQRRLTDVHGHVIDSILDA